MVTVPSSDLKSFGISILSVDVWYCLPSCENHAWIDENTWSVYYFSNERAINILTSAFLAFLIFFTPPTSTSLRGMWATWMLQLSNSRGSLNSKSSWTDSRLDQPTQLLALPDCRISKPSPRTLSVSWPRPWLRVPFTFSPSYDESSRLQLPGPLASPAGIVYLAICSVSFLLD